MLLDYYHKNNSFKKKSSISNTKIESLLEDYCGWAEADFNQEKLSLEEGEKIGACLTTDYFNGKISVNELALLCGQIYGKLDKGYSLYKLFKKGYEISRDIRKNPTKAAENIENLFKYFDIQTSN